MPNECEETTLAELYTDQLCAMAGEPNTTPDEIQEFLNSPEEKIDFEKPHSESKLKPIYYAAHSGNPDVLLFFIYFHQVSLDCSHAKKNIVAYALENPNSFVLQALLDVPKLSEKLNDGTTPFHLNIVGQYVEKIEQTLKTQPEEILKLTHSRMSAISWAKPNAELQDRLIEFCKQLLNNFFAQHNYEKMAAVFRVFLFYYLQEALEKTALIYAEQAFHYSILAFEKMPSLALARNITEIVLTQIELLDKIEIQEESLEESLLYNRLGITIMQQHFTLLNTEKMQAYPHSDMKSTLAVKFFQRAMRLYSYISELDDIDCFQASLFLRKKELADIIKQGMALNPLIIDHNMRTSCSNALHKISDRLNRYFTQKYQDCSLDLFNETIFSFALQAVPKLSSLTPLSLFRPPLLRRTTSDPQKRKRMETDDNEPNKRLKTSF